MTFIIIICILGATALITCLIFVSIERLNSQKRTNNILQFGKNRDYYIYDLLSSSRPHGSVIKKTFFPVFTPNGIFDTEVDIVCILNSGIAVLDIRGTKGDISVSNENDWVVNYKGKRNNIRNPREVNEINISAVKIALEKDGIYNVPVYNFVVFADSQVSFSGKYSWMLTPDILIERMKNLDNKLVLTRKDKQNLSAFFIRHTKQRHQAIRLKKRKNNNQKRRVKQNENKIQTLRF